MESSKHLLNDWTETDGRKRRRKSQTPKTATAAGARPKARVSGIISRSSVSVPSSSNTTMVEDVQGEISAGQNGDDRAFLQQWTSEGMTRSSHLLDSQLMPFNDIMNSFSPLLGQACFDLDASFLDFETGDQQLDTLQTSSTSLDASNNPLALAETYTAQAEDDSHLGFTPHVAIKRRQLVEHLHFYRYFGPTAITPGLKRVAVRIQAHYDESLGGSVISPNSPRGLLNTPEPPKLKQAGAIACGGNLVPTILNESDLFDDDDYFPSPALLPEIYDVFFSRFGCHYPFLELHSLRRHHDAGVTSAFQLNAIAALASRFCSFSVRASRSDDAEEQAAKEQLSAPTLYLEKAKQQMVPLLSVSSEEVVAGLLMLALAEFGERNESGLWMFVGMASRMAFDLGFQEPQPIAPVPSSNPTVNNVANFEAEALRAVTAQKLLFWSVFVLDTILSAGTGRRPSINKGDITMSAPTKEDIMRLQPSGGPGIYSDAEPLYPQLVGMFLVYHELLEVLNAPRTASSTAPMPLIHAAKDAMVKAYSALPTHATLSSPNFEAAKRSRQTGVFLTLHLYFFMLMIAVLRTELPHATSDAPAEEPPPASTTEKRLLTAMIKATVDTVQLALHGDVDGFLGTPIVNQCIYAAACAMLDADGVVEPSDHAGHEHADGTDDLTHLTDSLSQFIAHREFEFLRGALQRLAGHFRGVEYIVAVLDDRMALRTNGGKGAEPDLSGISRKIDTFVRVQDPGIIRRYNEKRGKEG